MRVGFEHDLLLCPEMPEPLQAAQYIPSFGGAGIKLSIAIGTCPAFAKAIIGFGIYNALLIHGRQVTAPVTDILSPLQYHRTIALLYKPQSREKPCRTGSGNNDRLCIFLHPVIAD